MKFVLAIMVLALIVGVFYLHLQAVDFRKSQKEFGEEMMVLTSLANIYYSMHLINLDNYTIKEYEARNQVKAVLDSNRGMNAIDAMKAVITATIHDAHLETALTFTDVSTLKERMQGKSFMAMDFLGKNVGWIRMTFVNVNADRDGTPHDIICATQIIDAEKKREAELIKTSNVDALTGCFNRHAYETDLSAYPNVPTEDNYIYGTLDINGLKVTNDTYGHEAGDELIVGAVSVMKRCLGPYGKLYRVGGDEFAAILFADKDEFERIQNDFREQQLKWKGEHVNSLAISCGFASKREYPDLTVPELANVADKRMYQAKADYYRQKGVDRRGQHAAHTALCALYTKILKINLTDDSYRIVNMDPSEQSVSKGYSEHISEWLREFGLSGHVHPNDLENYLQKTDTAFLKQYFHAGNTSLAIPYRRKTSEGYREVVMEMIPADDYASENQSVFLYVK